MEIKDFLSSIGITKHGYFSAENEYVIDIDTYDEYGKYFSILEKAQDKGAIEQLENSSVISIHTTDVSYATPENTDENSEGNRIIINLNGDLDQDIYKLITINS